MPKPAKAYNILETSDTDKALSLISFPIARVPVFCKIKSRKHTPIPKEAIFRMDTRVYFETISPDYTLITHQAAFEAMTKALSRYKWSLQCVSLDQDGARMSARFRIDRPEKVGDSIVVPEITLVNSYNTATALAIHAGTFSEDHGSALTPSDVRRRWMHLGNKADPRELGEAVGAIIKDFDQHVIPLYRKMAEQKLTKLQAIEAVILGIRKGVIPNKLGKFALHYTTSGDDRARSAWEVYSVLLRAVRKFKGTPTRLMELQQKIARHFKDGGKGIIGHHEIKAHEIEWWLQKSAGIIAA